ncbi:MAG: DNA mismatch repair endonuclease MutL [Bacteroidales bacterium]
MDIIHLLPDSVANQIAAGEVIQRPASVVKELVENSVDAGATHISIIIKDAGRTLIQIIDNGIGMSGTDARLSFERHATSKIRQAGDLFTLQTMGFRGEALASIAAIAHIELRTRREEDELGTSVKIAASVVESQEAVSTPVGTNFSVKDIFYNIPARRKFLKSNQVEFSNIVTEFERIAIVNPQVSFSLTHNAAEVYNLQPSGALQRIISLFGKTMNNQLLPVSVDTSIAKISGFAGKPESARKRGALQFFFVNGRYMRHPYLHKAIMSSYENIIPVGEMPNYFINFTVDPKTIDVNIHPTKTEIKFENEQHLWPILSSAVKEMLGKFSAVPSIDFDTDDAPEIPIFRKDMAFPSQPQIKYNSGYNPFKMNIPPKSSVMEDWGKLYHNFENAKDVSSLPDTDFKCEVNVSRDVSLLPEATGEVTGGMYIQIKGRYIITSIKSGMVIVDQHRAHTRVLYDKYIRRIMAKVPAVQKCLFPEIIHFSPSQSEILAAIEDELSVIGFEISNLGSGSYSVNGIPEGTEGVNYEELLRKLIDSAMECGKVQSGIVLHQKIALTLAQQAAIPYGQVLTLQEMEQLTEELFTSPDANFTPDGKHTLSQITNDELTKRFK